MRKYISVEPLFSKTIQGILATTLMNPDRWWYLSDLAKTIHQSPSSLQRPLLSLVQAGILQQRKDGNRVYFQRDPACPFMPELTGLILKTVGLVDVLREVLRSHVDQIQVAFIYGSIARSEEISTSDVDLMLVGSARLSTLSADLNKVGERLHREVNATIYTPQEFSQKLTQKHHFLTTVMNKEKLFVIGNKNDLERIRGGKKNRETSDKPTGTR